MSAPDPPSSDPLVGQVLGRHLILRLLGQGGMGAVYESIHQDLGRRAAIKVLHERYSSSAELRQRFLREGQAASRVRHPNVVEVYDVGVDGKQPYLLMEFLAGEDLGQLLAREGVLFAQRTADLLLPVVAAVAAAHDIGVIHRDLKPENIFLSKDRNGLRPKVLDFGISKLIDRSEVEQLTGTGAFLGTPQYMSPEQAQGAKNLDHASDQYSLGVILYLCVTGRRPVEESSLYALIQRVVRGEFPPPHQLNQDLAPAFEAVILRAMALDPGKRFATTRELGRALLEFASEQVRGQHTRELSNDALALTDAAGAAPTAEARAPAVPRLGTTLGQSVHERDVRGAPKPLRRRIMLGGGLAAASLLTLAAWRWTSSTAPLAPPPAAAAGVEAATLPPSAPQVPAPEPANPRPPASDPPPAPPASVVERKQAAPKRQSVQKRVAGQPALGEPPGLAPR